MSRGPRIAALLLAAGSGRRFGGNKLLAAEVGGVAIGVAAARHLRAGLDAGADRVLAVVRPDDRALTERLTQAGLEIIENPLAATGMASSLQAGVRASPDTDAWLIALADMPWIKPSTIAEVAEQLRAGASIAAPVHGGQRGHPVGFAAHWRAELLTLSGDQGARALLRHGAADLRLVPVDDPGILADVDHADQEQSPPLAR